MTVPGIGVLTAVSFVTAVDDPARFVRSFGVGADFDLTPRWYQSGEVDLDGSVSNAVMPSHPATSSRLEALPWLGRQMVCAQTWGARLARRIGSKKPVWPSPANWQ
ncbi:MULTISPECIES: transposase [unclassified Mesorhizobium]